jgi:hypothetical protein
MVRNMIQKALPLIALMSVVVTARYAIAETGLQCYNRLGCGSAGGRFACYGCCDACGKAAVNCQEACDGNPLPNYEVETPDFEFPPNDGIKDTHSVS